MCGIAGWLSLDREASPPHGVLEAMHSVLKHRGPDANSIWQSGPIGLAHRRLSIIDLSEEAVQPFFSDDKRFVIIFNGEIYNYREVRQYLVGKGCRFRTGSDTEVLLQLYMVDGEQSLNRLNGMFAFAIWDTAQQELFVARDRVGVKPLYYALNNERFVFASEQKAILKSGLSAEVDASKLDELLLFRYVAGEETLFKNVYRLSPGHFLKIKNGRVTTTRWWDLRDRVRNHPEIQEPFEWFEATFNSSVKYRMISDVPVGILLSGGLDSGSVGVSLANQGFSNISSFTVAFREQGYNEAPLARAVADKFGLHYHELVVPDKDLLGILQESSWLHDEPLAHHNDAHLYAIAKFAKPKVTVLLSGEGSDELMGGYVRYKPLEHIKWLKLVSPLLRLGGSFGSQQRIKKLAALVAMPAQQMVLYNACNLFPRELSNTAAALREHFPYRERMYLEGKDLYPASPLRQAMYLDQFTFMSSLLDRNDRMTMGASIECREPFLDYRLIEGIGSLSSSILTQGAKGKYLLFNTLGKQLPQPVKKFKKWGFGIPWRSHFMQEASLREVIHNLPSCDLFKMGVMESLNVKQLVTEFQQGNYSREILLRQLVMMGIWYTNYFSRLKTR